MIVAKTFTITSYGKSKEYPESQRKKMIKEFDTAMLCCDGSEAERKHSKKCTFYTLRFGCSFAAVNTIKPQLL